MQFTSKSKYVISILAILFGIFVLVSSLIAYSNREGNGEERESEKKLYISTKILPDHVFYPILMVIDQGLLAMSDDESEIYLRIHLAQDRMLSAQRLLDKDEEVLALSTLTKSQKYLISASEKYFSSENFLPEVGLGLLRALRDNTSNLRLSEKRFDSVPTGPIGDLILESENLISVIEHRVQP